MVSDAAPPRSAAPAHPLAPRKNCHAASDRLVVVFRLEPCQNLLT